MPSKAKLLQQLTDQLQRFDISRHSVPVEQNVRTNAKELYKGYDARTRAAAGREPAVVDVYFGKETSADNGINRDTGNYSIQVNPNTDEAVFAHELGHIASRQTDVGGAVRNLRDALNDNPQLRNALLASSVLAPGLVAMSEEGNNDLDASLAAAAVTQLPTLLDEGLATRQGLAIMDNANRRASLGQRGKLAGGFMSYLAPAVVLGLGGNAVGNMLD